MGKVGAARNLGFYVYDGERGIDGGGGAGWLAEEGLLKWCWWWFSGCGAVPPTEKSNCRNI